MESKNSPSERKHSTFFMTLLVYVWLGEKFPSWARSSLLLSRQTSGLSTLLLSSKKAGVVPEAEEQIYLDDFYTPPESVIYDYKTTKAIFRDAFWIKTTERFAVLEQYMKKYAKKSIFHAELDNLVFNISLLGKKLDAIGSGLFCPRDSVTRGIASLIYINNLQALGELNQGAFSPVNNESNDMELLGRLLQNSDYFYSLPTEAALNSQSPPLWNYVRPEFAGGIFDGAALGQFIFGIDPKNVNGPLYNGFENENKGIDLWSLIFSMDYKKGYASVAKNGEAGIYKLYNIHLHSKLFDELIINNRFGSILDSIHEGNTTLISVNYKGNVVIRVVRTLLGKLKSLFPVTLLSANRRLT